MRVRAETEVLDSLAGVLRATQEESVGTGRSAQGKLVQGEDLTTGLLDAGTGGSGEAQSGDRQLGDSQEAVVVGDGADDNNGLALLGLGDVGSNSRERDRGAVDARHEETAENSLVEVGLRAAYVKYTRSVSVPSHLPPPLSVLQVEFLEGFKRRGFHTSQEAVQLHKHLQVNVVALGSRAVAVAHMVTVEVDT